MYYNSNDDLYRKELLMSSYNNSQVKIDEQQSLANEKRLALLEASYKHSDRSQKLTKFLPEVKNMLVTEAIFKLVKDSISPSSVSESLITTAKNITTNFVLTEGADNLLNRFTTKTYFLSEMSRIIRETYNIIFETAKETFEDDFTIKNSDLEAFYNKLNQLDYDKMTSVIQDKVRAAEEKFVQDNVKDRQNMEELAEKTKNKIDSIKAKDKETEEAIKQEHTQAFKEAMYNSLSRQKSLLEVFVNKTSNSIITDSEMKAMYTLESGKLDTSSIVETAEIMYTFLEAVNTAKIKDVTIDYINSLLESI